MLFSKLWGLFTNEGKNNGFGHEYENVTDFLHILFTLSVDYDT